MIGFGSGFVQNCLQVKGGNESCLPLSFNQLIFAEMNNPTRRNRNIGTYKQGHGQNNKLTIPSPCVTSKTFYERLDEYEKTTKVINGHEFIFVIEKTREHCSHACSVEDVERIVSNIPVNDYGSLRLIIFRQPKRKETILSPVWGRLIYSYEFENDFHPAIIIEATDYSRTLKWSTKLSVDSQKEFERLGLDGHLFVKESRNFVAEYKPEYVRNTQLYRTLPHEFGHYVHYLEVVQRPSKDNQAIEDWEKRDDFYFAIPSVEKEKFAHLYADRFKKSLIELAVIPFDRIC